MIQARPYQVEAVQSIYNYFSENTGNPVLALPTGTGKSVIIAMFLESCFKAYPNQRVMVLTHVKELIQQNYEKLITLWPAAPAGVYSAGLDRKDTNRKITFGGIGSVVKKAHVFGHIDLIIIDEAHLVSANDKTMYQKFLNELIKVNLNLKVIGLTATPWRSGTGKITNDGIFSDICFDLTGMDAFNSLIESGYLAALRPKKTKYTLDVEGVHIKGGEFVQTELQQAVDKHKVTEVALKETLELGSECNHWLVFASGVEHACNIADMLNEFGISAVAIHSKMSDTQRDQAIADFKSGKYRAAVNNNVLTTGFDFPAIDLIVVLRPTASPTLWVQMLGRGTRPSPATGKEDCLVLDFASNTSRLGPINDPVLPRKRGQKGGEAPVKVCDQCDTYNHASVRYCAFCAAQFSFQVKIKQTASSDELLRSDSPILEIFQVNHVTYSKHEKVGRPPIMKTTYYCGLRSFSEYVCFEHEGYALLKAKRWWKERTDVAFPDSTAHAIESSAKLTVATQLRIWINKKYPEIVDCCFDGKSFETD